MRLEFKQIILLILCVLGFVGYGLFDSFEEYILFYSLFLIIGAMYLHHVQDLRTARRVSRINDERLNVALAHIRTVIFDNVLEADITNDVLVGGNSTQLTKLLNIAENSCYSETIDAIVEQLTAPEFKTEYWHMLSRENILKEYAAGNDSFEYECIERSDKINYRWIRIHIYIFRSQVTDTIRIISYVKNIDNAKRQLIDLLERSQLDAMTGTYNRNSIPYVIGNVLMNNQQRLHAIILIDIDDFKSINDTYGHIAGDKVIAETAKILKGLVRPTDFVARMGGDEFLVFMTSIKHPNDAIRKATDIQTVLLEWRTPQLDNVKWTFSMGIRIIDKMEEFDDLYYDADQALYQAKSMGKNQYCSYCEVKK